MEGERDRQKEENVKEKGDRGIKQDEVAYKRIVRKFCMSLKAESLGKQVFEIEH